MAREWLLRGVDPEELKPDEKIAAPVTPKGWLENFWYHHKWAFLGGLFAVVVATVLVVQLVTRDLPDYHVLLMTKQAYLDPDIEAIENLLAQYGQDLDEDGKVEVSIQNCRIDKDTSLQQNSGFQIVQAHLMAGDVLFFVWDESAYELVMDGVDNAMEEGTTFLTPLPPVAGVEGEGLLYNWAGDPRAEALEAFPETLLFGVRDTHGTAGDADKLHEDCMALLEAFIEGRTTTATIKDEPMATVTGDETTGTTTTTEAVETTTTKKTTAATKKAETTKKATTTSATKAKVTTTTKKKSTVVQAADFRTGISWDGKSPIVYTYTDGTTGTTPKDGATYEVLPGKVSTYYAPKDVEVSNRCPYCDKTLGDGQNGTCVVWLMGDVDCPNCGEHVKSHTCHTCEE